MRNKTSIVIPNLVKHLVHSQSHLQDIGTTASNTTAMPTPGRDTPTLSSVATPTSSAQKTQALNLSTATRQVDSSSNPSNSAQPKSVCVSQVNPAVQPRTRPQGSGQTHTRGQTENVQSDSSLNKQGPSSVLASNPTHPVLPSQKTQQGSGLAQATRPSVTKQSDCSSNKQLASLLALAQSIPLSLSQVCTLLQQASQNLETSKKPQTIKETENSPSSLAQPTSLTLAQLHALVQQPSQNQEMSKKPQTSITKETDSSTSSPAQPKLAQGNSLTEASQNQPLSQTQVSQVSQAAGFSATQQLMNKHPASSFLLASNSKQPDPVNSVQVNPTVLAGGEKIKQSSNQPQDVRCFMMNDSSLKQQPTSSSAVLSHQTQPKPMSFSHQVNATTVARAKSLSSSELTQPVPLEVLIQHKILEPKPRSLTCTVMVC